MTGSFTDLNNLIERNKTKIKFIGERNEKIKQVKALIANTKPNPRRLFAAEGIWSAVKIIELNIPVESFIFCPQYIYSEQTYRIVESMLKIAGECFAVSDKVFDKLSERDKADGLLAVCGFPKYEINQLRFGENALVVVLDGCEIPGNVGTIARTCDGAGADAILLCNRRVRLTHPKIIKGSMGGAFTVPFVEFETVADCCAFLAQKNFSVFMADTRAEKFYYEYEYKRRTALVVGSEKYGISREWYDGNAKLLSIPMLGVCDSLNVGVAASIILYDMSVKLGIKRN